MGLNGELSFTGHQLETLWSIIAASAPFWLILGGVIGILLPRPRWLEASGRSGALFYITPPGLFFRRAALLFHGAYVLREIWNYFKLPDATRDFWTFFGPWSQRNSTSDGTGTQIQKSAHIADNSGNRQGQISPHTTQDLKWYVDESDLQLFKTKIEKDDPSEPGEWEPMMDRDFGTFTYTAWRRKLKDGSTDYKSVTVASNATAEEFMDFYLDDPVRMKWDSMISETEVLENGQSDQRCQVVRWIRSFPFYFISKREYVIARRMFKEHGCLYGITKAIDHPRAILHPEVVRMDVFYSMWRSRTIPDPKGGSQPACETVLLHHEDFKIAENLARFAVKTGMGGFVKKLGPEIKQFVEKRRQRVDAYAHDPEAFGVNTIPNPPLDSEITQSEADDSISEMSVDVEYPQRSTRLLRERKPRRLGKKLLVASAIGISAVLIGRRKNPRSQSQNVA